MTQVPRGNRQGVALPIRIHDLLLSLAGRLDDDALCDARQMLASAELDRSLEFVAGCLVAGRVVLSKTQQRDLESLFSDTYLDPSVIDRLVVREPVPAGRHRFAVGAVDGREPDRGVADAVRPVLDVLPDVRSVWCVWRLTPAGPVSGPVPHRVVLVGVGPGGFAPATAYRVEYALRRAGIRASVEVLVDGNQPGDYHQEAMRCARQVPFAEPDSANRPRMSPVEPVRTQPFAGDQRHNGPADAPTEMNRAVPRPVDLPRAEGPGGPARTLPPPIELPQAAAPDDLPPPIELRPERSLPTPPAGTLPPPVELRRPEPPPETPEEQTLVHKPIKLPPPDAPAELVADQPQAASGPVLVPEPAEAFAQERLPEEADEDPDELPPSALSIATPSISRPSPRRRPKPKDATRPRLVPASKDNHSAAFGDDILNTQERNLLRELQDELARRENQEQGSTSSSSWSGRHGRPGDSPRASGGPVIINGTSPNQEGRGYPPAT
ncbi:MAG TPA: hypothetical protein VH969_10965 [Actinophytocola sp.]|uniref:hypothetical protein n=1 Tax=Actinophytocola sp. TaxID=1872138 RepID=UPI002F94E9ED